MRLFQFIIILLVCLPRAGQAQNSTNYLQLFTNAGLNFTLNDPADLEQTQTINNAFTIRIRSKNNSCSVYARISSYNVPSGFYPSSSPLALDWTSDTSPNASNLTTTPINVETYDKLLFTQPKITSTSYYDYFYNLQLNALGYDYPTGNYNFTFMFTMTQP